MHSNYIFKLLTVCRDLSMDHANKYVGSEGAPFLIVVPYEATVSVCPMSSVPRSFLKIICLQFLMIFWYSYQPS